MEEKVIRKLPVKMVDDAALGIRQIPDGELPGVRRKRKTKTSTAVKSKYNKKTYTQLNVYLPKEKAELYKRKCMERGITYSELLHKAIDKFIEND